MLGISEDSAIKLISNETLIAYLTISTTLFCSGASELTIPVTDAYSSIMFLVNYFSEDETAVSQAFNSDSKQKDYLDATFA